MRPSIDLRGGRVRAELLQEPAARIASAIDGLGELVLLTQRLAQGGRSVLSALIPEQAQVAAWAHWPEGDAQDPRHRFRWFYHCHGGEGRLAGEHGHFHVFSGDKKAVSHLVAISVDAKGLPLGLFTPNRWVTGEHWLPAARAIRRVERFTMAAPRAVRSVSAWLSAVLRAFSPQVRALLRRRDARLADLEARAGRSLFDDRRIPVLSRCTVDLREQAAALDALGPLCFSPSRRRYE